jgi:hypothetical protein
MHYSWGYSLCFMAVVYILECNDDRFGCDWSGSFLISSRMSVIVYKLDKCLDLTSRTSSYLSPQPWSVYSPLQRVLHNGLAHHRTFHSYIGCDILSHRWYHQHHNLLYRNHLADNRRCYRHCKLPLSYYSAISHGISCTFRCSYSSSTSFWTSSAADASARIGV